MGPPGYGVSPGWASAPGGGNPEAAYWERRYRRLRTWTLLLVAGLVAGVLVVIGGGLLAWNVLLPRAASSVSQGLTESMPDLGLPGDSAPAPDVPEDGDAPSDLSGVPLPEQLRGLGSALGIENVEELLDAAVSMGLMSQEQADQLREAAAAGGSVEDLLGSLNP